MEKYDFVHSFQNDVKPSPLGFLDMLETELGNKPRSRKFYGIVGDDKFKVCRLNKLALRDQVIASGTINQLNNELLISGEVNPFNGIALVMVILFPLVLLASFILLIFTGNELETITTVIILYPGFQYLTLWYQASSFRRYLSDYFFNLQSDKTHYNNA